MYGPDQRRQFLAPLVVGREQVRLMQTGGDEIEQHDADAERQTVRRSQGNALPRSAAVAKYGKRTSPEFQDAR
jgi:hypothetical protein